MSDRVPMRSMSDSNGRISHSGARSGSDSNRMASRRRELMERYGCRREIEVVQYETAVQKGVALRLWAETDKGCVMGANRAGKPGGRSESIAEFVVKSLMNDLGAGASTDSRLQDRLILFAFAALAKGRWEYLIPRMTEHVESNLWMVDEILDVKTRVAGNLLEINGIGFLPPGV